MEVWNGSMEWNMEENFSMEWNMEENFSVEWNMEENFSMEWNMEWKTFGMEWKKIANMEYIRPRFRRKIVWSR